MYRYRYCTGNKTPGEPGHRKKTTLHQYLVPYVPVPFYRSTFARAFMRVDTTSSLLVLLLGALSLLELWSSILSKNARALDVWLLYTFETCWPKAPLGGPPTRYRASMPKRRGGGYRYIERVAEIAVRRMCLALTGDRQGETVKCVMKKVAAYRRGEGDTQAYRACRVRCN
jgi:hypothetical protein